MKMEQICGSTRRFDEDFELDVPKSEKPPGMIRHFHNWIMKYPRGLGPEQQDCYGVLTYAVLLGLSFHFSFI